MRSIRLSVISILLIVSAVWLAVGCASPIPVGRYVKQLHWSSTQALSAEQVQDNNLIRLQLYGAFQNGHGRLAANLPATTYDLQSLPQYLIVENGIAHLMTDYRRNRVAGKPAIDNQLVSALRLGYYERGHFVEADILPPAGRELFLLVQLNNQQEVRF